MKYSAEKSNSMGKVHNNQRIPIYPEKGSCLTIFNKAHAEGATIWKTTRGRRKLPTAFKSRVNVNKDDHSHTLRDIK